MPDGRQVHGLWQNSDGDVIRFDNELSIVSGTKYISERRTKHHWIARQLRQTGSNDWQGDIYYQHPSTLGISKVEITFNPLGIVPLAVTLKGGSDSFASNFEMNDLRSRYFRTVDLEMATEGNVVLDYVTSYNTHEHPNRPNDLPNLNLTIVNVFEKAGIDIRIHEGRNDVPISKDDREWDDNELNQAMLEYCKLPIKDKTWTIWFLNASMYTRDTNAGIMFDAYDQYQRHGSALFNLCDYFTPPADDPNPEAWIRREKFKTTIHEIGHCFNLYHSREKECVVPWISLKNENNARSFMNDRSHDVNNFTLHERFYADFYFTFTKEEILFMRHAPDEYVQMGNSENGYSHG